MFPHMKRALVAACLIAFGCRPSDGQSTPANTPPAAQAGGDSARQNEMLERADAGRIQGSPNAPIWIVEISDFQCPYCKQWHEETYPIIQREFIVPGHVRLAYVNLPLTSIHPHAAPAAEAAMCAAVQNKFWEVHDALFATQDRWKDLSDATTLFDSLTLATGVNEGQWRDCMRSKVMQRLLNGDRQRAGMAGVVSTPVFFVGDEMIRGAAPIAAFRAAIQRARAKAAPGNRPSP
jgi:protein-disulfide isomerase